MSVDLIVNGRTYRLDCTCGACPEQYDVFDEEGLLVGYLRLRHGRFRCDRVVDDKHTEIYAAHPKGDGIFEADEREQYLTEAIMVLDSVLHKSNEVEAVGFYFKNTGEGTFDLTKKTGEVLGRLTLSDGVLLGITPKGDVVFSEEVSDDLALESATFDAAFKVSKQYLIDQR